MLTRHDQKIIEVRDLVEGIINDRPLYPDFRAAARVSSSTSPMLEMLG